MARPTPLALLLAVASVLAGCDIVDLETPAATMTTTGVYVLIAENDSVVVEISAYVNAGIDVRGHARQLDDPVLVVNGRPLQPTFEHPDDYMYRTTMGSAAARDGLVFRLPRVTGFAGQPIELNVPVLHRAGGRNLQLRGGDLVLELAPAPIQNVGERKPVVSRPCAGLFVERETFHPPHRIASAVQHADRLANAVRSAGSERIRSVSAGIRWYFAAQRALPRLRSGHQLNHLARIEVTPWPVRPGVDTAQSARVSTQRAVPPTGTRQQHLS